MDVVGNRSMADLINEKVDQYGDKAFLVYESDDGKYEEYTYRQFDDRINRLANALIDMGVKRGDKVTLMLTNCPEFILAWFAVNKAGAVMVPGNVFYAADELEYMLNFSDSVAFITEPAFLPLYEKIAGKCSGVKSLILAKADSGPKGWHLLKDLESKYPATRPSIKISPEEIAEIIFTSGTTARPKGAMLSHRSSLYQGIATAMLFTLTDKDRFCVVLPLFHVNAQFVSVVPGLTAGGTLILLERYSATKYWSQVVKYKATLMSMVPMILRTLLTQPESPLDKAHSVRFIMYALPTAKEEWESFMQRFNAPLIDGYGLSETFATCTVNPVQHGIAKRHCVGLPTIGREVRVVNDEGKDVPFGQVGHLIVKGEAIFSGYYKNPEAYAECMKDGWLDTGDNGYQDEDGYFYFFDRTKEVIKRAGENIAASEVERVINDHPKILESAVVGVPDPLRDEAAYAVVVLHPGQTMTEEEVKGWCGKYLSKFKIPSFVEFRDSLPHTSIGKVIKYQVKAEVLAKLKKQG